MAQDQIEHLQNQQLIFLLWCRRLAVLPTHIFNFKTHITFNSNCVRHRLKRYITHFQKTLFNLEIKDTNFHLKFFRSSIYIIERKLFESLPSNIVLDFFELNVNKIHTYNRRMKAKLTTKFSKLKERFFLNNNSFFYIDISKWIINLSSKQIPPKVSKLLSLGEKFGLPFDSINRSNRKNCVLETIKNIEANSFKIRPDRMDDVRMSVVL